MLNLDLKPDNIFLEHGATASWGSNVKIGDFGIAYVYTHDQMEKMSYEVVTCEK